MSRSDDTRSSRAASSMPSAYNAAPPNPAGGSPARATADMFPFGTSRSAPARKGATGRHRRDRTNLVKDIAMKRLATEFAGNAYMPLNESQCYERGYAARESFRKYTCFLHIFRNSRYLKELVSVKAVTLVKLNWAA